MQQTFEQALVENCAPTLAGVKPASLFQFHYIDRDQVCTAVAGCAAALCSFGITLYILKECRCRQTCLVYVCRVSWVQRIVTALPNCLFLGQLGYPVDAVPAALLRELSRRLCLNCHFPHEIGLFLGYPLEDVVGFIRNKGENYTYRGLWKAYGDPDAARKRSDQYCKCMRIYKKMYAQGTPIRRLIVAA